MSDGECVLAVTDNCMLLHAQDREVVYSIASVVSAKECAWVLVAAGFGQASLGPGGGIPTSMPSGESQSNCRPNCLRRRVGLPSAVLLRPSE